MMSTRARRRAHLRSATLLAIAMTLAGPGRVGAATFDRVTTERLHRTADLVAVVRILDEGTAFADRDSNPSTRWRATILRQHRGPLEDGRIIDLVERGGELGGRGLLVSGVPRFRAGEVALLFLTRRPDGAWRTHHHDAGVFRPTAEGWEREPHTSPSRIDDTRELESLGIGEWLLTGTEGDVSAPVRQTIFEARDRLTMHVSGNASRFGSAKRYVELAMQAWNDDEASHVFLLRGEDRTAAYAIEDGVSAIVLDSEIPDADSSVAAQTSLFYRTTISDGEEPFFVIEEADIAIRPGLLVSPVVYAEILTHELGHVLGFRHSNEGTPASSDAVMRSAISGRFGPSLGPWDRAALLAVYPQLNPPCTTPRISISGHEQDYENGSDVLLTSTATEGDQLEVFWYRGIRGDRTTLLGVGKELGLTSVREGFPFWVLVVGSCGYVETPTLELRVTFCEPASVHTLDGPSRVIRGSSATLTAVASGQEPLTWEWFDSDPSSGPAAIGNSASFTTPPLNARSMFWVRASNSCGASTAGPLVVEIAEPAPRRGVRPPGH